MNSHSQRIILLLALLFLVTVLCANMQPRAERFSFGDVWKKTKKFSVNAWEKTKDFSKIS